MTTSSEVLNHLANLLESAAHDARQASRAAMTGAPVDARMEFVSHGIDGAKELYIQWLMMSVEDANEHPTISSVVERQHPSQGTRLQPGSRDDGEAGAGPGENWGGRVLMPRE